MGSPPNIFRAIALLGIGLIIMIQIKNASTGASRGERGKLVVTNKDECACPKGDDSDWANGQYFYCGSQINAAKCDVNAIYSCQGKKPGDVPVVINKCNEECRLNTVSPVAYCSVEYNVPKRGVYSGDPESLKANI